MSTMLRVPIQYRDGTPEYLKANTNGCGSGWTTAFVPNRFLLVYDISQACNAHDICYKEGKTEADKSLADDLLHDNILALLDNMISRWRPLERLLARMDANLYHDAVKEFGHDAFWKGKPAPVDESKVTLAIVSMVV
jgi:hypothetical protein